MDTKHRLSTCLALSVLGAFTLLILLAGFVPEPKRTEVRHALNRNVTLVPEVPPATRPLNHVLWQVRGLVGERQAPDAGERDGGNMDGNAGGSVSPLAFENGRVMLRTAKGLAPVQVEKTPILGGLLPLDVSLSGAAAEAEKTTLRLGAESLACRLSSPARQRLLESLREWESRRNAQAASLQQRASKYRAAVERYAARFKLQPELVYAIIYTESSFDPGLISSQNAHGLMQVVPQTAGGEVNSWLGNANPPSTAELLDPDTNIKYGTAYLHLLLTRHLNAIENPRSREYCAIAAYNIGSGAMLRVFGQTRESAFETISVLTPEGVRDKLLQSLPYRETRAFLEKVLAARGYFVAQS